MKRVLVFKNFAILLLCVLCISSYANASVQSRTVKANGHVANYHNDLVVQDMLIISSILKAIPIVGPVLNTVFSAMLNFVMMFEYTTNNLLDKILRDSLPCTISSTSIHCNGVYKNGGLNRILRRAVDSMPDTTPLYIIKKVLDPMMIFGTLLTTDSLY